MCSVIARRALVLAALAACGDDPARVHLINVSPGACGQPAGATHINVISYSPTRGEQTIEAFQRGDATASIADFPPDTEAIGVKVTGDSGATLAQGKTAPLAFSALHDGADLPVFMAPPDGFCPTGDLDQPRAHPVVAAAGAGALVVGGDGAMGPLSSILYYDPVTAKFSAVDVPPELVDDDNGLRGAVLTPLPDGRVVLSGTASHVIAFFDPAKPQALSPSPPPVFDHRAFHGAIAPDGDHVFVIGGCADVAAGACSGAHVHTSFSYSLDDLSERTPGPILPDPALRVDASLFDLGIQANGVRRMVLAGGSGDLGAIDRFDPGDALGTTEELTGMHAQVALLDGGAVLGAFAADGPTPSGAAGVLPPAGTGVIAISSAPPRSGARLVALEDGSVVAFGGDAAPSRYDPTTDSWTALPPSAKAPTTLDGPTVTRLVDGSVLVLDGTTSAWIFRPSLVGPQSGQVSALPFGASEDVLVPSDPSTVTRTALSLALTSPDDRLSARALVGGPRMTTGSVTARVRVMAGGVALIAQQLAPGHALIGEVIPGQPARIARLDGATSTTLATGPMVGALDPAGATIRLDVHAQSATLVIDGTATTADLSSDPDADDRGAWGIAADGPGAKVELTTITVTR